MKTKLLYLYMIAIMVISCHKDEQSPAPVTADTINTKSLTLQNVQEWYQQNALLQVNSNLKSFSLHKFQPQWDKAEAFENKISTYWLIYLPGQPTFQNIKQGYRKIAFMRDSTGNIQARFLEIIPDGLYWQRKGKVSTSDFTGYVFLYDQAYRFLSGKIYKDGKQVGQSKAKAAAAVNNGNLKTNMVQVAEDCNWYDSSYLDAEGNLVIHSDQICNYTIYDNGFYPDNGANGVSTTVGDPLGDGGDATGAPEVSNLPGETAPKIDPKAYMNCFGSLPDIGSKMKVTVYVQEPMPGLPFNYGSNSVGHAAIGLTKTYNGQSITQVVGLYPDATGKAKIHAPSKVLDNSFIEFNVSVSYDIIASEFNKIVAFVGSPPSTYDLTEYNCTNFVYDACKAGGITLPNPYGNSGIFSGGSAMTPGALGGSISGAGEALNVNNKGGTIPQSHGPCN